jgi:hypothetical protein
MSSGDVIHTDTATSKTTDTGIDKKTDKVIDTPDWPPINAWHLMAVAAGSAAAMGVTVLLLSWNFPTVVFMLIALIAAGGAVWLQPRCALLLCAAAGIALLVAFQMRPAWDLRPIFGPRPIVNHIDPTAWDSARAVTLVLAGLALFAAGIVSLPRAMGWVWTRAYEAPGKPNPDVRRRGEAFGKQLSRAIISVFVLIHFTGISCAFLSVPPPMRDQSWVAQWGWTALQPYLQFMYLINAYRFYSPEPGPASLMWYYVIYEDGEIRELRVPTRDDHMLDPLGQEFTRRLSISESTNQLVPLPGIPDTVKHRRIAWGDPKFNPALGQVVIPLHPPPIGVDLQYRVPMKSSQLYLQEYARKVAQLYPTSPRDPSKKVKSVKIYRVTHRMLEPGEMTAEGKPRPFEPTDPWTYMPFYQGEFVAPEGKESDPEEPWVLNNPDDPFLYWLIPIFLEPQPIIDPNDPNGPPKGFVPVLRDCLKDHVRLSMKPEGGKK